MKKVVGVRFKQGGKIYYFDPSNFELKNGMKVIVDTVNGDEFGEIVIANKEIEDEFAKDIKKVIKIATYKDEKMREEFKQKEDYALKKCQEKVLEFDLPMKLLEAEYKYDGTKLTFYFVSENRIDFRELVKSLASIFKTRIEMRQVSSRDEIKLFSGNGVCGRELCCCSFLNNNEAVTIKMIKEQNLSLNMTKNSGTCGRLKCCLKFEHETYCEKIKLLPKVGSEVKTQDGVGEVDSIEILKENVRVKFYENGETFYKKYNVKDIVVLKEPKSNKEENEDIEENLVDEE